MRTLAPLLCAVLLVVPDAGAGARKGQVKKPMLSYEAAVEKLQSQETWCEGAEALARHKDRRALVPLVRAYRSRSEGRKVCLLEAMEALQPKDEAQELFDRNGPGERLVALFLMEYFPDDRHLLRIQQVLRDADPEVRSKARRALFRQYPTPAWEAVVLPLLDAEERELRLQIVEALALQMNEAKRQALQRRLTKETDAGVRRRIEEVLR